MTASLDPFEPHIKRAESLFEAGDVVQAGQIWQAILKKNPDHEAARAGLYKVKLCFDARATQGGLVGRLPGLDLPEESSLPIKPRDPEVIKLLEQGCTLYDAGHIEEGIRKWEQVLVKDPDSTLAKGYIAGARTILEHLVPEMEQPSGVPPEVPAAVPVVIPTAISAPALPVEPVVPVPVPEKPPEVDAERLLRDGCTLFDMGQVEDALKKWEQILAADSDHALARAYVQDARKDLGLPPLEAGPLPAPRPKAESEAAATTQPPPSTTSNMDEERIDRLIRDGVQLYDMGMLQEASHKWEQVLKDFPDHADAKAYLAMARRDLEHTSPSGSAPRPVASAEAPRQEPVKPRSVPVSAPAPIPAPSPALVAVPVAPEVPRPRVELELVPEPEAPKAPEPPVVPPPALTGGGQKARKGLNLPESFKDVSIPQWLTSPAFVLGTITIGVFMVVGIYLYRNHQREVALKQAIAAFRASALTPVQRSVEIPSLKETPENLRKEAQSALDDDPLLAYYRAKELARIDPGDATAADLVSKAQEGLAKGGTSTATQGEYEKKLKEGDLDSADQILKALLRQDPEDPQLRAWAERLYHTLAQLHAAKGEWDQAREYILHGRAMFPGDSSWGARLRLLDNIQSMSKENRDRWIQFLG